MPEAINAIKKGRDTIVDFVQEAIEALENYEEMKNNKVTEKRSKLIEETLASVDDEKRRILELLYVRKARGNVDKLCRELYCEARTIYRKRDAAIREFTMRFFGVDK